MARARALALDLALSHEATWMTMCLTVPASATARGSSCRAGLVQLHAIPICINAFENAVARTAAQLPHRHRRLSVARLLLSSIASNIVLWKLRRAPSSLASSITRIARALLGSISRNLSRGRHTITAKYPQSQSSRLYQNCCSLPSYCSQPRIPHRPGFQLLHIQQRRLNTSRRYYQRQHSFPRGKPLHQSTYTHCGALHLNLH